MNRVARIRLEEKKYHDSCYEAHRLFEPGSWLQRPVKTVLDLLEQFSDYPYFRVLDLGSGIGRNSIPIAESMRSRYGKVVCVDLLESALEKLVEYSEQYGVSSYIEPRLSDIDHFAIEREGYDLIVAVSTLEHVSSELVLERKLKEMRLGTRPGGVNCIIIGSNIREVVIDTGMELYPMFEVNLPTEHMLALFDRSFAGWDIQKRTIVTQEYDIEREGQPVRLTTDCITFVAKNSG